MRQKSIIKDLSWYRVLTPALANINPAYSWPIAASIGRFWAPKYLPSHIIAKNLSGKPFNRYLVLHKMYSQWAVSSVVNYSFLKWNRKYLDRHVKITGQQEFLKPVNDSPVFYFSAHNFFMFGIISMLGLYGHCIHPVALDANLTVPPHLTFMFNRVFNESAILMNGGYYIFTDLNGRFNRGILNTMRRNNTFFAAVDFPKGDFTGKWQRVGFMGGAIEIPSRLFKFAHMNNIPSFFVHMRWDQQTNKLVLDIENLFLATAGSTDECCALFATALGKRVAAYPESWEGWKWPGVFK